MHDGLRKALDDAKLGREAYLVKCRDVWREVQVIDPELAAIITSWDVGEDRTVMWLCEPTMGYSRKIPAEAVVEGNSAELKEALEREEGGY